MDFIFDKRLKVKILIIIGILTFQGVWLLRGENEIPFRHDESTIFSVYEPLAPCVKQKMQKRFSKFIDYHERTINRSKGVYKAAIPANSKITEWEGFKYLFLVINQTNDVRLILGNDDKKYMIAPKSEPGVITDRTLFFGPSNAGICFYYQATRNELRAVVSPLGLQEIFKFKRLNKSPILKEFRKLDELSLERNLSFNSITNFAWHFKNKNLSHNKNLIRMHNEKIEKAHGTYVFDDKKFLDKLLYRDVDKWFFVIQSETEVYWIEEVDNQLFFVLESRPGKIDEIFLTFGPRGGSAFPYKVNAEGLSTVFNYAMGFYDDEDDLDNSFLELDRKGLFQTKLFFRRTKSIPSSSFPVRSRYPGDAFKFQDF